jgi:hypothetical protein
LSFRITQFVPKCFSMSMRSKSATLLVLIVSDLVGPPKGTIDVSSAAQFEKRY